LKKRAEVKKFLWILDPLNEIDFELLELQLHSLYKINNINFSERLYKEDLAKSDGYMVSKNDSRAISLALKSFCRAFLEIMRQHGILVQQFDYYTVEDYGEYELILANSIISESKGQIRDAISGKSVSKDMDGNLRYSFDLSTGKRIESLLTSPLSFLSLLRNDAHITAGSAIKKMSNNLYIFEKSIVECAVRQIKQDFLKHSGEYKR